MKKLLYFMCMACVATLFGCSDKITETVTYQINEPVFMDTNAFRSSVNVNSTPQEITQQGKICFYEGYLYISEPGKGIHIIDNRNPSNPQGVGFIEVVGNADLAIRNNKLYADSYIDLVWFDISNPALPVFKSRLENVFPTAFPLMDNGLGYDYSMCYSENGTTKGIVVGWNVKERTETVVRYKNDDLVMNEAFNSNSSGGSSSGLNGSMSRFSLYQDYLYIVINNNMSIFNLTGADPVKAAENIPVGWNVETIFSYKDCMFMGTPTGMIIYSVKDPLKPEYQSAIAHVYGCDPVVVENDIAYVTVHSGNNCGQNNNELLLIDVKDVKKPQPIVAYTMTKPKGLGIDNGTLFLCDDGLKVYKADNPQSLMANQLVHYAGMEGYDVIPHNNILMMIADDGIYQYDFSNLKAIKQLSKLTIAK